MALSPLPHEALVTGHCLPSSNQRGANSVTLAAWHTKSLPRMLIASKATFLTKLRKQRGLTSCRVSITCHKPHTRLVSRGIAVYASVSPSTWGICNRASFSVIQSAWSKQRDGCSLVGKIRARKLVASKAAFREDHWWLALGFWMDLRLNATRRNVNLSVYLVFDLGARRF